MDWSNERYVRLYTRDSADMIALRWEGRLVLYELLRKVDRAGVLDHGGDLELLPDLLRIPPDIFRVGLERLAHRRVVMVTDRGIVVPNFLEAQEVTQTDAQRQRESRAKRRAKSMLDAVTNPVAVVTEPVAAVTNPVTNVTRGHTRSHAVTPAEPNQPNQTSQTRRGVQGGAPLAAGPAAAQPNGRQGRKKPKPADPTAEEATAIERVLAKLSERSGREYRPTTVMHARRVLRLLRERSPDQTLQEREMDLRAVVWDRANEWAEDPKMDQFLRPSTVFGPEKFPDYLAQARAAWANRNGKRDERPRPGAVLDALAAAHAAGGEE